MNEFDIIADYFSFSSVDESAVLGVGDDCALLSLRPGEQLAVTTDTLVAGRHFPADGPPELIARRAMRVNLSDIAAMGAEPLGFQLALTLESVDRDWLRGFSLGLARDAAAYNCPLVGGDTTRGPATISITMFGRVPEGRALLRSAAEAGDAVYVTGTLGDAAAGLDCLQAGSDDPYLVNRYWLPEPRLAAGQVLRGLASAALDISDGLVQDLGHIARASVVDAIVEVDLVPVSAACTARGGVGGASAWALGGGDDYELCFTVPESRSRQAEEALAVAGIRATRIGTTVSGTGLVRCVDSRGREVTPRVVGYDHFRS